MKTKYCAPRCRYTKSLSGLQGFKMRMYKPPLPCHKRGSKAGLTLENFGTNDEILITNSSARNMLLRNRVQQYG